MTYEQTKLLLEQLKRAKYYAKKQQEDLAELIISHQSLTCKYGKISVQTSNISDVVSKTVEAIETAQKEYAQAWDEVFKEIEHIKGLLQELPSDEKNILEDYYIRGKTVRYIGRNMNYDHSQIVRKKETAIKKLAEIIKDAPNTPNYRL